MDICYDILILQLLLLILKKEEQKVKHLSQDEVDLISALRNQKNPEQKVRELIDLCDLLLHQQPVKQLFSPPEEENDIS